MRGSHTLVSDVSPSQSGSGGDVMMRGGKSLVLLSVRDSKTGPIGPVYNVCVSMSIGDSSFSLHAHEADERVHTFRVKFL